MKKSLKRTAIGPKKNSFRSMRIENLEERQLLSTVGWDTPVFDQDAGTMAITGKYTCDQDDVMELKLKGFFENDKLVMNEDGANEGYADIRFSNIFGDMPQSSDQISKILSDLGDKDNNEDGDATTDQVYTMAWGSGDVGKYISECTDAVLLTATYSFDLTKLTNGAVTDVNFIVLQNIGGTETEISNQKYQVTNDNGVLKLYENTTPSLTLNNEVNSLNASEAVAGRVIADVVVNNLDNYIYKVKVNGVEDESLGVNANSELVLLSALEASADSYKITVEAYKAEGDITVSDSMYLTVVAAGNQMFQLDESITAVTNDWEPSIYIASGTYANFETPIISYVLTDGTDVEDYFSLAGNDSGDVRLSYFGGLAEGNYELIVTMSEKENPAIAVSDTIKVQVATLNFENPSVTVDQAASGVINTYSCSNFDVVNAFVFKDGNSTDNAGLSIDTATNAIFYNGTLEAGTYTVTVLLGNEDGSLAIQKDFALILTDAEPSLTLSEENVSLDASEAVAGKAIADVVVSNFVYDYFNITINGNLDNNQFLKVENGKLVLVSAFSAGTYVIDVQAFKEDSVHGDAAECDTMTLTVTGALPPQNAVWDISNLNYGSYILDATAENNVTATLFGITDNTRVNLGTFTNLGADALVTIIGNANVAETLNVTYDAMSNLGDIVFNGGDSRALDNVTVLGSANNDQFIIDSIVETTTTPVITVNPYVKLLNFYKAQFGENSTIYQNIKKVCDKAFERLGKIVQSKKFTYSIVELTDGAALKMTGTGNVTLNALAGNDSVSVATLSIGYTLVGGEGNDTLDFSGTSGVSIDMDSVARQYAVPGQIGTIRLNRDFETVIGSARTDRILGSSLGTTINGNGGSDAIVLIGGTNRVTLNGNSQSVVMRGNGVYNVNITNGNFSVINAAACSAESAVTLNAAGSNVTFLNGFGAANATITGDFATANCLNARTATLSLTGAYAKAYTGNGADSISVIGDFAVISSGASNDAIAYAGSNSRILAGEGNDGIVVVDGENSVSTNNFIYGENGNDFIYTPLASGNNYLYAGNGNDILFGGAGNDWIYGMTGNNVLIGLSGLDRIYGGTGRDLLMASRSRNLAGLEEMTPEETTALYRNLWTAWCVDNDLEETLEILGAESLADGSRDELYRGGGFGNLFFTNTAIDNDFENAFEFAPFLDRVIDTAVN